MTVRELCERARATRGFLASAKREQKDAALEAAAKLLWQRRRDLLDANAADMAAARQAGLNEAMCDRLLLTEARVGGICEGLRGVAALPDPVGETLSMQTRPNGLVIEKVSVPMGVIAVIFESRPNVSADSAALCLKSGNAAVLRGGREAIRSNKAIVDTLREALAGAGFPEDCVCLVEDTSRESASALMKQVGLVDLLIPRGGRSLIDAVVRESAVPVIETGAGVCHIYVDRSADAVMASDIIYNAKVSRPSVCNACECILVHRDAAKAALPVIWKPLKLAGVELRGDERTRAILPGIAAASADDYGREYNDLILACRIVDSEEEALAHIEKYGTRHSEAIVTRDAAAAETFLAAVDAAAVYVNASTRFTDGGVFGLGAEIGISTQKLHARGPLGLRELTTYKYLIRGNGQVRE
ncbi:MAG: glutamate-5-semialdehyde dehydrogenase [Oscillospiraceae bacterium]|nr:glutamate-5-semialdehyde dehydrogenase [Oscillospiraceae bacterium]